ncbi:hypothetical protein H0O01_04510 [Candidatus Micrarchaeota archaeon]|nr:hypothetical protein [Candidatus Micrarchaeota archaeon]
MKTAEKNPENRPVASPPNQERRRFLRDVLLAGTLAPLACSKEPAETAERRRLFQNSGIRAGSTSIILASCNHGKEFSSAHLDLKKDGDPGMPGRVSMIVPSSFEFQDGGFEYELYVDGVSCETPQSADVTLVNKGAQPQDDGKRRPEAADLFTIGAAAAFLASIFYAIFERKSRVPDDGLILPPKRNH